ncbi:hypothetical protein vseg_010227 [Gypsophila vaccaria]
MATKSNRSSSTTTTTVNSAVIFSLLAVLTSISAVNSLSHHRQEKLNVRKFEIADDMFWKDGVPFRIIGGDLHYFRVLPEYWEDRLMRAKALGLNTIQTYVPWNLHEPSPGNLIFDGISDIKSYLKLCQKLGFLVMLRPGPYICGEWDLGGFPAWLLDKEPPLRLRSSDPAYLKLVDYWWGALLPMLVPFLYENGGPIIMVQMENEYGSYGDDQAYLHHLVELGRRHLGNDVILYTTDGGTRETLEKGTIRGEGVYTAVDFSTGELAWPIFKLQKEFNAPGKSPPLSSEFYTGWLTHWGEKMAKTDATSTANELEKILARNGSVVLYMVHGGTNFGFYNGANTGSTESDYKPDLTSYDYDAPIRESGDVHNAKFRAIRRVIRKYAATNLPPIPSNNEKAEYGYVQLSKVSSLFDIIGKQYNSSVVESSEPMSMESVGQAYGFLLYVSEYTARDKASSLLIQKVHDRAQVFVSCYSKDFRGKSVYVGTIERWSNKELQLPYVKCASSITLFILVENMGRINYGPYIFDRKGILSPVYLDDRPLHNWKMFLIHLPSLNRQWSSIIALATSGLTQVCKDALFDEPGFYSGRFTIETTDEVKDTFLSVKGWGKGIAFINGFNIGRYWPVFGPQCNLYVPAPLLSQGENTVVLFELENANPDLVVKFTQKENSVCGRSRSSVRDL